MKTAVSWLYEKMPIKILPHYKKQLKEAQELFKQQIEKAHIDGGKNQRTSVQYYNETYKSE
jgi:2-iminoacetate synthase ThiH